MNSTLLADFLLLMMPITNGLKAIAFGMIWAALKDQKPSSDLGVWINRFFLSVFVLSILNFTLVYYLFTQTTGDEINAPIRWVLVVGLNVLPLVVAATGLTLGYHTHKSDAYAISEDGIWATLTRSMPIIVADSKGIIQHTTPAFDDLINAVPGELIGKDLKTIMPQRYRDRHDGGIEHYVRTREARIVGTVVTVEMLRMDGVEIPIYLALNTADVDGEPWFLAAIWRNDPETPDTIIAKHRTEKGDQ